MTRTIASPAAVRQVRYLTWIVVLAVLITVSLVRVLTDQNRMTTPGTLRLALIAACPILLAGLGGLWAERAGIVNIGLEGQMLLGTWGAAFFAYHFGAWAGVLGAIAMGALGGLLHGLATVTFGVDHIISGVAINIVGLGAVGYLAQTFFIGYEGGGPRNLSGYAVPREVTIPGISSAARWVSEQRWFLISDVAGAIAGVTTRLSLLTILALLLVAFTAWVLWRTPFGLRLRSCGESPQAAETLGVNVYLYKYIAVIVSGGFAGLGGAYLAMVASSSFTTGQTNGRGYIGLASMIFGNWNPTGVLASSLMFGYADGISLLSNNGPLVHAILLLLAVLLLGYAALKLRRGERVTAFVIAGIAVALFAWYLAVDSVPSDFTGMTPYILTLFVLAVAAQRLRMPAADGKPYRKGQAG